MRLDGFNVVLVDKSPQAKFEFEVTATLEAKEEADIEWGLNVNVFSHGLVPKFGGLFPVIKQTEKIVGDPQRASGLGQGETWRAKFEGTWQLSEIGVPGTRDMYVFTGNLVPLSDFYESNKQKTLLEVDLPSS